MSLNAQSTANAIVYKRESIEMNTSSGSRKTRLISFGMM